MTERIGSPSALDPVIGWNSFPPGAKVRGDSAEFTFHDPTALITWLAPDRGVVTFPDLEAVRSRKAAVVSLVNQWVRA